MMFKFHHIAVACHDIEKTAKKYELFGYRQGPIVYDDIQQVNVCFLDAVGMPSLELISSDNEKNPVKKILDKNGVIPYHFCFITENLEDGIHHLMNEGFIRVSEPAEAIAIDKRKIAFMYSPDSGLIELIEGKEQ